MQPLNIQTSRVQTLDCLVEDSLGERLPSQTPESLAHKWSEQEKRAKPNGFALFPFLN
jgi:hypothetical protein